MGPGRRDDHDLILLRADPAAVARAAAQAGLAPRTVMAAAALLAAHAEGVDPSSLGPLVDGVPGEDALAAGRSLAAVLDRAGALMAGPQAVEGTAPERRAQRSPAEPPPASGLAHRLGALHEALVPVPDRRRRGVHYTPADVAARLVALALDEIDPALVRDGAGVVVDPACGGGVFLLAAADALVARGEAPAAVLGRLVGIDLDPLAVDVTTAALALWVVDRSRGPAVRPQLGVGDALALEAWADRPVAAVVGNPPFGGQLDRRTARDAEANRAAAARLGAAAGYADTAALFLARALDEVAPGGAVALLQPVSVLGTRDAAPVRDRTAAALRRIWFPGGRVFAAGVDVCAPVLRREAASTADVAVVVDQLAVGGPGPQALTVGSSTSSVPRARLAAHGTWAPLWAAATGVPPVDLDGRGRLGDRCRATAGFRDEFYALAAVVHDDPDPRPDDRPEAGTVRVLTSGLVDPLAPAWGRRPARLAGRRLAAPVARLDDVAASPERRLRAALPARTAPKVVVATQSRVVEVVVDAEGWWWPSVPLVAVTPATEPDGAGTGGPRTVAVDPAELWLVAGALMAPPVTAWALQRAGGTALSAGAVKLSARQVLDVPLPLDAEAWRQGAAELRAARPGCRDDLVVAGRTLTAAHGLEGREAERVVEWWAARLPEVRP